MSEGDYLIGPCEHCLGKIEFPKGGLGEEAPCPHCGKRTMLLDISLDSSIETNSDRASATMIPHFQKPPPLPPPLPTDYPVQDTPPPPCCKNCGHRVAKSAEHCFNCGQKWPSLSSICPNCGDNDFDIQVDEDDSSVLVPPSIIGVLSYAIWEGMKRPTKVYFHCYNCGCNYTNE